MSLILFGHDALLNLAFGILFRLHAHKSSPGCGNVLPAYICEHVIISNLNRHKMKSTLHALFRISGEAFSRNFFEGLGSNFDDYVDQLDDSGRVVWLALMCIKVAIEVMKLIVFKSLDPIGSLWCRLTRR